MSVRIFKAEIGVEQFTMAYSCPKTIGDIVRKAKPFEVNRKEVSNFIKRELNLFKPPFFSFSGPDAYASHPEKEKTHYSNNVSFSLTLKTRII